MMMSPADPGPVRDERELIGQLPLPGARVSWSWAAAAPARPGCSRAAASLPRSSLEVDRVQHALNLRLDDLSSVRFGLGGAEDIPAADASVDAVFLFKSLLKPSEDACPSVIRLANAGSKP